MGMEELVVVLVGVAVMALLFIIREQQSEIASLAGMLKDAIPPEVLEMLKPAVQTGVGEVLARAQAKVESTPNTMDDQALEQIRALLVQLGALKDETAPSPD